MVMPVMVDYTASALDGAASKVQAASSHVPTVYGLFMICILLVYWLVANGEFSSILTLSVMFQGLSHALLGMQVFGRGNTSGISGRSLALDAMALVCRLSSTTWLNGYLPVDASGDYIFQVTEGGTLLIALWLLSKVRAEGKVSFLYDENSLDNFPVKRLIVVCGVLASLLHADMNSRPFFDAMWMLSLFLNCIAVLPQLWLINRLSGKVEALICHRLMAMAVSRLLSFAFMWHARGDITCAFWIDGFNHAVWAILGAHLLHIILLGDFAYYYINAVAKHGFIGGEMDLEFDFDLNV